MEVINKIAAPNQNLEKQMQSLIEINRKLEELAYLNAHKTRAPIARILGLLALNDHNSIPTDQLLELLKSEAESLDSTIKSFSNKIYDFTKKKRVSLIYS